MIYSTGEDASDRVAVDVLARNGVTVEGDPSAPPIVFGPGYGTSQNMWRLVAPQFTDEYRVVRFDHVGSGESDVSAYDRRKYDSLRGYAADLLEILRSLDLHDVVFVGHSVSAMIGALAAIEEPERFGRLIMLGPSPRYLNDEGYVGGFERADVDALLDALEVNHVSWAAEMAPALMRNPERPELAEELAESIARTNTMVAQHFARVTFLSDTRRYLKNISTPTLILQSTDDLIAPPEVGEYLHENIPGSELVVLSAAGHYAHLSDPAEIERQIRRCL
ncbi:alpha/beta hydrolase [Cryobacterium sp. SO2]|uniref:alpha/beta fold hydrolase n=1 Tax=Cryobacterium sp. SO2 TaxID=1897060 RepID=UPI00223D320F|nr:alpha/beta hydrolase [Cryobacterium sp. SO2]WEO77901.1 alpha/beta hydrolase [Cryobacterium sp. SO2]